MDVRVRERLVGALVLVAIVVMLVPAVLTGPERTPEAQPATPIRSVEVLLEDATEPGRDERLVPEPVPQPATAPPAKPAPPADPAPKAETPRNTSDPAVASGRPLPPPATVSPAPAWAVQLGAFSTRDKAERLVADLRKRGYAAFVLEYRANGQVLHRVRVGPEQERERAAAIADRLRKDGFQPVVAPHP